MTAPRIPRVEVLELRDESGELTGRAVVRAFLGERGVEAVTPRRSSVAESRADVEKIERLGLHVFALTYPGRTMRVIACDAEDACDLAQQRWGSWPAAVDEERAVTR